MTLLLHEMHADGVVRIIGSMSPDRTERVLLLSSVWMSPSLRVNSPGWVIARVMDRVLLLDRAMPRQNAAGATGVFGEWN